MKVNEKMDSGMDKESSCGRMEVNILDNGNSFVIVLIKGGR